MATNSISRRKARSTHHRKASADRQQMAIESLRSIREHLARAMMCVHAVEPALHRPGCQSEGSTCLPAFQTYRTATDWIAKELHRLDDIIRTITSAEVRS